MCRSNFGENLKENFIDKNHTKISLTETEYRKRVIHRCIYF